MCVRVCVYQNIFNLQLQNIADYTMAYILSKTPILCRAAFHKNIILGSVTKITKSYMHQTNKTNVIAERKFRLKDNISDNYKLIYREENIMNVMITFAYNTAWIGIIFCTVFIGYLIYKNPPVEEQKELTFSSGAYASSLSKLARTAISLFSLALIVTVILCCRIIPFRIYHNSAEKLYKAVFVRSILGKKQIVTFGEGTVMPIFKRKHAGNILFNANGRIILLDRECFPIPYMREQMIYKTN